MRAASAIATLLAVALFASAAPAQASHGPAGVFAQAAEDAAGPARAAAEPLVLLVPSDVLREAAACPDCVAAPPVFGVVAKAKNGLVHGFGLAVAAAAQADAALGPPEPGLLDCAARLSPYWEAHRAPYCMAVRGLGLTPDAAAAVEALLRMQGDTLVDRVLDPLFCELSPTELECATPDRVLAGHTLGWAVPFVIDTSWAAFAVRDAVVAQASAPPGEADPLPACEAAAGRLGAFASRDTPAGLERAAFLLAWYVAAPQPAHLLQELAASERPAWGLAAVLLPCTGHAPPTPATSEFVVRELVSLLAPQVACWLWYDTWCAAVDPWPLAHLAVAEAVALREAAMAQAGEGMHAAGAAAQRLGSWAGTILDPPWTCEAPAGCALEAAALEADAIAGAFTSGCACPGTQVLTQGPALAAAMRDGAFRLGGASQEAAEAADAALAQERPGAAGALLATHAEWVVFVFLPQVDEDVDVHARASLQP